MYEEVECPYCGKEQKITANDGNGCEEDTAYDQECRNCGKNFVFHASISVSYDAYKADCLNGGQHEWTTPRKIIPTMSDGLWRRSCGVCEKQETGCNPEWATEPTKET